MTLAAWPTYDSYKDSGVEWIGQIPAHWEVRRSKYVFTQRKELARKDDVQLSATQSYGVIPQDEFEELVGRRVVKIQTNLEKRKHVEIDDFVISMRSFQGGLERAFATGCIRSSYVILQPLELVNADFFGYLFKSPRYIKALQVTGSFIRDGQDLNFDNFSKVDLFLPPLDEQAEIAAFLDEKCAKVDEAVRIQEEQIALLRERRQILIQEAVTRGLNSAAPMKDSGIDWIGQIPAHWERRKVRHLFSIGRGRVIPKEELAEDGLYPVFSSQTKNDGIFGYLNSYDFDQDQLTWTTDGANAGTVFRRRGKHNCTNVCGTLRPKTGATDLDFCVHAVGHAALFYKRPDTNGAKIMNEEMAAIEFPLPPIEEQELISMRISEVSKKTESGIAIKEEQITALKEYKTSLINAAVTGKIKVA